MKLVELAFPAEATRATPAGARTSSARRWARRPSRSPTRRASSSTACCSPTSSARSSCMESTGLEPAAIDACMTLGAGHPMGPLALLDFVGLDVAVAIGETIGARVPERLRALVAEGALGRKSGRGHRTTTRLG